MAAPLSWNNSLRRGQSSILNKAAQGDSVQFSTEQGQWHSFPGEVNPPSPQGLTMTSEMPSGLDLDKSTLSLSGTLTAPRAGVQTPGFSHQPWNLIFLAWITRQVEHFCYWPFKGSYWPRLQPGWKVTLIKATLYKQGTGGEFFPGIHLDLVLGAVPQPKHWECCSPGFWSTLDLWVQPLRQLLLCLQGILHKPLVQFLTCWFSAVEFKCCYWFSDSRKPLGLNCW